MRKVVVGLGPALPNTTCTVKVSKG